MTRYLHELFCLLWPNTSRFSQPPFFILYFLGILTNFYSGGDKKRRRIKEEEAHPTMSLFIWKMCFHQLLLNPLSADASTFPPQATQSKNFLLYFIFFPSNSYPFHSVFFLQIQNVHKHKDVKERTGGREGGR